jgi:hypothetical protein
MTQPPALSALETLPLWRLLVALDDTERISGPSSDTARILARVIQERLRREPDSSDYRARPRGKGVRRGE